MAEQSALQPQFISEVPQHLQVREGGPEVPELTKPQLISFTVEEVKSMLVEINDTVDNQDRNRWRIDSEGNLPQGLGLPEEPIVILSDGTVEAGWQIVGTVRGTDGQSDRVIVKALDPNREGGTLIREYPLGFFMEMQLEIAERIEAEQDSVKKAEFSSEQGYCRPITEGMRAAAAAAVRSAVEAAPPDDIELMRKEATNLVAKFASDPDHKYIANLEKQHARLTRELEANWKANYENDPKDEYKGAVSRRLQQEHGPIYQRMRNHPDYKSYETDRNRLAQLRAAIEEASQQC
ncbi:MAG: hypothetical protein WAS94_01230 [Candidatus Saccharimonadales bacterium]